MSMDNPYQSRLTLIGIVALVVLPLVWVYLVSVGAGYLFDDYTSVVPLRVLQEDGRDFWMYVFGNASGALGRPVSVLTFALEQLWGSGHPDVSQRLSILIHLLNFFLVFGLINLVLRSRVAGNWGLFMALVLAFLWAATPQKMSTVLYIVQRMAMLSALLMLLAMAAFLAARLTADTRRRAVSLSVCLLALLVAPFAKENGVLTIAMIAMLEVFAVPPATNTAGRRWQGLCRAFLVVCVIGFAVLGGLEFQRAPVAYADRNFDFLDRTLSTPLVLADYARQFFIPDISRMGLLHDDFELVGRGASPLAFIGTSIALLLATLFLLWCIVTGRRGLLPLGIGIFLVGHSLESTFLPLEVYFEHRNYLPSVGLVLLVAAAVTRLVDAGFAEAKSSTLVLGAWAGTLLFSTALLGQSWTTKTALFEHHYMGHPRSSRANSDYALILAGMGFHEDAMLLSERAFELSRKEPSADPMGSVDRVAFDAMLMCIAKDTPASVLPPVSSVLEDDPFRGGSLRSLQRMHDDEVCSEEFWTDFSDWMWGFVSTAYAQKLTLRQDFPRALAKLEYDLGNWLRAYTYAGIAAELQPQDGQLVIMQIQSASEAGDFGALESAATRLEELAASEDLNDSELRYLRNLRRDMQALGLGQADSDADPQSAGE